MRRTSVMPEETRFNLVARVFCQQCDPPKLARCYGRSRCGNQNYYRCPDGHKFKGEVRRVVGVPREEAS